MLAIKAGVSKVVEECGVIDFCKINVIFTIDILYR